MQSPTHSGLARVAALLCAGVLFLAPRPAAADQRASFALIVGSNASVDKELRRLRYADDDAVRYFDLFRLLGLRTYLLTRPDRNTRRLHPQAIAEAHTPRRADLDRVVRLLSADVSKARRRGLKTEVYFVYAGHGNVKQGRGYLTLEDDRLTSQRIRREIIDPLGADTVHLIVDACHSYFLADSRGPGGKRRRLHGFSRMGRALLDDRIGLLLSNSAARESHEWEAFQAGVFSHEVRSGLYGAADANGDGRVSYREIAAFVHNANVAIPNERFRPRVFARPPKQEQILLDLRLPRRPHLKVGAARHGRYLLETSQGIRLLDFHSSGRQAVRLLRPLSAGTLYLRRLSDDREYALPPAPRVIKLAALSAAKPRVRPRGAAHHAFSQIFSRPYSQRSVTTFELRREPALALQADAGRPGRWRKVVGWGAVGLGAAALATGLYCSISAVKIKDDAPAGQSHRETVELNDSIDRRNAAAIALYATAGAAVAGGVITLLWPEGIGTSGISLAPGGASIAVVGEF